MWDIVAILGGIIALGGLALYGLNKVSKAGASKERNKTLEAEKEGTREANKRGEDWDSGGGLLSRADKRLQDDNKN